MIYRTGRSRWGPDNPYNNDFEQVLADVLSISGTVLDVGCGQNKVTDTVIGVDPFAENDDVNIKAYMWDMPFADNSVDAIVTFHALEHISKYQVLPTLNEFARVLKPGNPLIIVVPDLNWVLQDFLDSKDVDTELLINWKLDTLFGIQTHDGEYHRTGYTNEIIKKYLSEIPSLRLVHILNVIGYNQWNLAILIDKVIEEVKE